MQEQAASDPILILTGPPGSGKTTVSQLLAEQLPRAVQLESDEFFHFIRSGYVEPWGPTAHDQNTVVMRIVADAASTYANAGYFTIIDGIIIPGWFFEPLRDSLTERGHQVAYAVLRASVGTCQSRCSDRALEPLSDASAVKQLWNAFAGLGEPSVTSSTRTTSHPTQSQTRSYAASATSSHRGEIGQPHARFP